MCFKVSLQQSSPFYTVQLSYSELVEKTQLVVFKTNVLTVSAWISINRLNRAFFRLSAENRTKILL